MKRGALAVGDPSSGGAVEPSGPSLLRPFPEARVASGVPGLDDLVGGGFPRHRAVLVCGDIGTGKTTFGLQFLMAGVDRGESGVLVSVDEKPPHVIEDARRFGWNVSGAIERGLLTVLDASPLFMALRAASTLEVRHVAGDLAQQVRQAAAGRLVIDGATSLAPSAAGVAGTEEFVRSLVFSLEDNLGCTTVLTARTAEGAHATLAGSSAERLASGVIELRAAERRSLLVRKMRGAPSAIDERPMEIVDGRGIVLQDRA
jgi:circadian clock protein KaiC